MAWSFLLLTQFILAAATLAVAGAVLFLRPQSPAHRSLALMLALLGSLTLANRGVELSDGGTWHFILRRASEHIQAGLVFTVAYFWVAYEAMRRGLSLWGLRLGIGLAGVGTMFVIAAWPCLTDCVQGDVREGPLAAVLHGMGQAVIAVAGLAFARRARRDPQHPGAHAHWLMGLGFTLLYATFAMFLVGLATAYGSARFMFDGTLWSTIHYGLIAAAAVPAGMAGIELARAGGRRAWWVVATASLVLAWLAGVVIRWGPVDVLLFTLGLARFAFPALIALAVVRHRLLDSDLRVRLVVRQGVVASAFAGTFLVLSETVESVVPVADAWAGVGAAVVIALALRPLQKMATRLAHSLLPHEGAQALPRREREALFRDQAMLVWEDGSAGDRERRALEHLAGRLGLAQGLAQTIVRDAMVASDANA